jgi:hypothetical protein
MLTRRHGRRRCSPHRQNVERSLDAQAATAHGDRREMKRTSPTGHRSRHIEARAPAGYGDGVGPRSQRRAANGRTCRRLEAAPAALMTTTGVTTGRRRRTRSTTPPRHPRHHPLHWKRAHGTKYRHRINITPLDARFAHFLWGSLYCTPIQVNPHGESAFSGIKGHLQTVGESAHAGAYQTSDEQNMTRRNRGVKFSAACLDRVSQGGWMLGAPPRATATRSRPTPQLAHSHTVEPSFWSRLSELYLQLHRVKSLLLPTRYSK